MYNLRYHIASLVSVFIALSLGLVLGGLIVDEGSPANNQAIVDSLKADIETVREHSAEVQAQNDVLASFIDQNVSALIADQLDEYAVIVIRDDGDAADIAQAVVTQAGGLALPFSIDTVKFEELASDSKTMTLIDELEKKNNDNAEQTTNGEFDAVTVLAATLATEWTDPTLKERPLTDAVIADGVLTAYGVDWENDRILGIVDATTQVGPLEPTLTLAIMKALAEKGYPAIVASNKTTVELEYEAGIDATGISALNTLGTSIGDYTLIALLKGASAGRYGTMTTASAEYVLMPAELTVAGKPIPEESDPSSPDGVVTETTP